jgi:hypothetical protein
VPSETRDDGDERRPAARGADLVPEPPRVPMPDTDAADVDPAVRALFWRSALMANVALFCLLFGPMLVLFTGAWVAGAATVVIGGVAGLRVYHLYLVFRRRGEEGTDEQKA